MRRLMVAIGFGALLSATATPARALTLTEKLCVISLLNRITHPPGAVTSNARVEIMDRDTAASVITRYRVKPEPAMEFVMGAFDVPGPVISFILAAPHNTDRWPEAFQRLTGAVRVSMKAAHAVLVDMSVAGITVTFTGACGVSTTGSVMAVPTGTQE